MKLHRITGMALLAAVVSIGLVSEAGGWRNADHDLRTGGDDECVPDPGSLLLGFVVRGGRCRRGHDRPEGFTMRGDHLSHLNGHFGVDNAGYDGVTIKNGVVRNFSRGLSDFGDRLRVSNVLAAGNLGDGMDVGGASPRSQSSTASGNGIDGMVVSGDSATVQSSTAAGNHWYGIQAYGNGVRIQSSVASVNGLDGIHLSGNATEINRNRAEANGYQQGAADLSGLGISVDGYQIAPAGRNVVCGNDDIAECYGAALLRRRR
jgi:hypothetical protein